MFASLFKSYAQAINKVHHRTGRLFEEPFRRIEVKSEAYFSSLVHYIHSNPQRHGFTDDYRSYPHSSCSSFLSDKTTKLKREDVLKWFGGVEGYESFHQPQFDLREIRSWTLEE